MQRVTTCLSIVIASACVVGEEQQLENDTQGSDESLSTLSAPNGSILWVGAHPDDELYVAPLLQKLCVLGGRKCSFLVITDGRKGPCHRAEGCADLVAVRRAEMVASALRFNAGLTMMGLEDTPAANPTDDILAWNNEVGGGINLVLLMAAHIKQVQPTYIFTFDPRHGSSCHQDHRAAGALTIEAARLAGVAKESVFMVEQMWTEQKMWLPAVPSDLSVLTEISTATWQAIIDVFLIHRSQFTSADLWRFYLAPTYLRYVKLLRVSDIKPNDLRYQHLCPTAF